MGDVKNIKRKASSEDIGFITKNDPWNMLSEIHGKGFKDYRDIWKKVSSFEMETDFPTQIDFELNNNCNYKCEMCTFSVDAKPKAEYFPIEKYKEIVLDGVKKGLKSIDFSFVNEPLIRKDLPELIRFAKDAGVLDLAFNTNGQLLTKEYSERLLASGLTRIQFSLDAFSADIFEVVRRGGNYKKVVDNIHRFLEMKKEKNVNDLFTAVSFVKMSINEHQWDDFVEYWEDKVDYIILREYLIPVSQNSKHYEDKKKYFSNERHTTLNFKCDLPWQRVIIRTDGTILPCCTFFAPRLPMGNIYKNTIEEIWKSKPFCDLRTMHKNGEYYKNPVCKECALGSTVEKVI